MLIRVHRAGVNPAETYIRAGAYTFLPELPYTPGGDVAGVVERAGPGVSRLAPGDRVFCLKSATGSYARHAIANEDTAFKYVMIAYYNSYYLSIASTT